MFDGRSELPSQQPPYQPGYPPAPQPPPPQQQQQLIVQLFPYHMAHAAAPEVSLAFLPPELLQQQQFRPYPRLPFPQLWRPEGLGLGPEAVPPRPRPVPLPPWVVPAPLFKRRRYVIESKMSVKCHIAKHAFRRHTDHFLLDWDNRLLAAAGPRRTYCKEIGVIYAVGQPDGSCDTLLSIGDSLMMCDEYASWMRRKLKYRTEPEVTTRTVNIIARADVPEEAFEIDLVDLYQFIEVAFPQWQVVFDPEISHSIVISRVRLVPTSPPRRPDDSIASSPIKEPPPRGDDLAEVLMSDDTVAEEGPAVKREQGETDSARIGQQTGVPRPEAYRGLPETSPVEILCQWMLEQEAKAFSSGWDQGIRKLPMSVGTRLYSSFPGWIKCAIIVTRKSVILHKAQLDDDIDVAWLYFFPLLRHFLSATREPSPVPAVPIEPSFLSAPGVFPHMASPGVPTQMIFPAGVPWSSDRDVQGAVPMGGTSMLGVQQSHGQQVSQPRFLGHQPPSAAHSPVSTGG